MAVGLGFGALDRTGHGAGRVTILYDAFGRSPAFTSDWRFSVLVETGSKRILFDTGNDAAIFERNLAAAGVDLTQVDAVVLSHRHSDHIAGLSHVLEIAPRVQVYVPAEPFGDHCLYAGVGTAVTIP
jgi:7,8-dihydropterin-6-yl-methyl-4-(beta-D-ribofuranosyl)aminobenzene 5'-phosphate synthase